MDSFYFLIRTLTLSISANNCIKLIIVLDITKYPLNIFLNGILFSSGLDIFQFWVNLGVICGEIRDNWNKKWGNYGEILEKTIFKGLI